MARDLSTAEAGVESGAAARAHRFGTFYTVRLYKDFRLLWAGNFFAVGAQWLQFLTIGWLVLKLTEGNALLTGTSVGIRGLPVLLIGPWAGVLADRIDRRKLVMATQLGMVVAASFFAFLVISSDLDAEAPSGPLRWWHPFVYMVVSGIAHAIIQPVRQAMVANTVPRQDLANALALNGMAHPTMRIVGPAVGGLLIATLGFKWNFFLEAVGYLAIFLLLLRVKLRYREETTQRHSSLLRSMGEGIRYVAQERRILQLIAMSMIPNFVFQPLTFLLPVFTSQVLHRGADAGGILAAAVGGGGIVAAVIIATLGFGVRKGMATVAGLIGGCVFVLLFAQSHWYLVSIVFLAGLGFSQYVFRVGNSTLLQTIIPDALRGRVMSIYMLDNGLTPLAVLVISLLVHFWNPQAAFTVIGGLSLFLAVIQALAFKRARQLE